MRDSHLAYERALSLGAQPIDIPTGPMELRLPAIKGIGGAPLYLIDRFEDGKSIYDIDFEFIDGVDRHPRGHGFKSIDHLTHNVYKGRMAFWGAFYERIFNFREIRYFDIQGEYTGLTSRAMTAPDGLIRIPLNEESGRSSGQIEEFLMKFNGEGIQHIALLTDDLLASVDALQMAGIPLMTAPNDIYYEMLEERLPGRAERHRDEGATQQCVTPAHMSVRHVVEQAGHAQAHQDEQHGDVPRVLHRCAEADDAGGAGNTECPRHRVADDDHHHRAGDGW